MASPAWLSVGVLCVTALLLTCFALRYDPQKPHARYLRHGVVGLLLLCVWNLLPLPHLGVNPLSVMVTGALGVPGLGLMAVMNLLP
ncbi:MAG: pro-sigmaK processing inhibitor BofA family protein [Clostridiales bacterium]|nr:pro-sigmaK processing inhibitor BofA family protein [Clostridiales bacterium]